MKLFDCRVGSSGYVAHIGGGYETHRRLVDLGLLGASYCVRARNRHSALVDFGAVSCVIQSSVAANIEIRER